MSLSGGEMGILSKGYLSWPYHYYPCLIQNLHCTNFFPTFHVYSRTPPEYPTKIRNWFTNATKVSNVVTPKTIKEREREREKPMLLSDAGVSTNQVWL